MTADLRRSPLANIHGVRELPFLTMVNLRVPPESPAARRIEQALGTPLPPPNRVFTKNERAILWLGPDEWLVTGPDGDDVHTHLRQAADHCSIVDVSANRTTIELSAPWARDLLEKGMSIDLHPRSFHPGRCAQTLLARALVILRQVDEIPTYHVLVRGSFAPYLAAWLADAAGEFQEVR